MSVEVEVFNRTNATAVTNGDLTLTSGGRDWNVVDAGASRSLNEPGSGDVTVTTDHPHLAALTYRNVVRISQDGEVIKAFVVNKLKDVTAATDDAKLLRQASGDGLLSRLKEMVRVTPVAIDELPLSYTRRHDWGDPATSTASWTDTIYTQDRTALVGDASNRPVGWPTPVAPNEALGVAWIHTVVEGDTHPAGTQYYHREFDLDADSEVAFFLTAADQFTVCLDGVEMMSEELAGPNSVWWWTWKFAGALKAGTHTIRIKVDVINGTGAAGMIFAAFKTGSSGINEVLFVSGDSSDPGDVNGGWKALDNPATPPGQTAGQIMILGLDEADARGVDVPAVDFDADLDSNGDPWDDTIPLAYRVPCTEWDVIDLLTPWVEFKIADDGYTLSMFNLSTGAGTTTAVEFADVVDSSLIGSA